MGILGKLGIRGILGKLGILSILRYEVIMKIPHWNDRWDDKAIGPIYIPIGDVHTMEYSEYDVRYYVRRKDVAATSWYAEPITCVKINGKLYATKGYPAAKVEACRRIGYETLLIIYIEVS